MSVLFSVMGDQATLLTPTPFFTRYLEQDLQRWADRSPALLNDGQPMLSLGTEIVTGHLHSIDNLFLDGNGHVVIAELKRGRSPREVIAQAIDYGAFARSLTWEALETYCMKRHRSGLDEAFRTAFGAQLRRTETPVHRLMIVAESYNPRVIDAATYLLNAGIVLALLQFSHIQAGPTTVVDVTTLLGEIPDQRITRHATALAPTAAAAAAQPDDGRREWLLTSLETRVKEMLDARYEIRRGKIAISLANTEWPSSFGNCQIRIETYVQQMGVVFSYRTDALPQLRARLEEALAGTITAFSAERLTTGQAYTTLSILLAMPEVGDTAAVDAILAHVQDLLELVGPLAGG